MPSKLDLAEKLIHQSGDDSTEAVEAQLLRLKDKSRRDAKNLRRLMWWTAGLWFVAICAMNGLYFAAYQQPGEGAGGAGPLSYLIFALAAAVIIAAQVGTVLLIFRLILYLISQWGSGRREANLRLALIDQRLRQIGQQGTKE